MAHPCCGCGGECYCHGDIDDCIVSLTPASCETCGCAEDEDWRMDADEMDYDPNEDYEGAIGPESICRQCGCHPYMACTHPMHGNCWWAEAATTDANGNFRGPLCSHCAIQLNDVSRPWQSKVH